MDMVGDRLVQCKICRRIFPELLFSDQFLDHLWSRHKDLTAADLDHAIDYFMVYGKDLTEKLI